MPPAALARAAWGTPRGQRAWACTKFFMLRTGIANTNTGGRTVVDGSSIDGGAVRVMKVVWPFRTALRGEVLNRPQLHWLKTVVVSVWEKARL
jgi:hypothetical protein